MSARSLAQWAGRLSLPTTIIPVTGTKAPPPAAEWLSSAHCSSLRHGVGTKPAAH